MVGDGRPFSKAEEGIPAEEFIADGEELLRAGVVGAAIIDAGVGDGVAAVDDSRDMSGRVGFAAAE